MKLRDFKIGFRLLIQEPAYSSVAIVSLALGIAVCILLSSLVKYALSFNANVPDRERIYLVKYFNVRQGVDASWQGSSPLIIRDIIKDSGLPVSVTGAFELSARIHTEQAELDERLLLVDPTFPEIVGIKAIEGDLQSALTQANSLAITTSMAEKLFATKHAVGKTLSISQDNFQVVAILNDVPDNASVKYQVLTGLISSVWSEKNRENYLTQWGYTSGKNYLKLAPNITVDALHTLLQDSADHAPDNELTQEQQIKFGVKHAIQIKLTSLSEVYFDAELNEHASLANRSTIFGLLALALLILFLAANNYVTLASVRTVRRQREIAVRKILGASGPQIASQFVFESLLVASVAGALGLLMAWLTLPTFSTLVGLELSNMIEPTSYLHVAGLAVILSLLTAAYPSYLALKVRPNSALAGRNENEHHTGLWMRRVLTVLQFSCALGLTSVCLCIAWQTQFASTVYPGYDTKHLWILDTPFATTENEKQNVADQLNRIPEVLGVSNAIDGFNRSSSASGDFNISGNDAVGLNYSLVTSNFFTVYGISALAGRLFDTKMDQTNDKPVVVLNAAAARKLGFASPQASIGQFVEFGKTSRQIIGISPEIRHTTLRQKPVAMAYLIGKYRMGLAIRTRVDRADSKELQQEIEIVWKRNFPNEKMTLHSAAGVFSEKYHNDLRLVQLLGAASTIAIAIAAFGIYVLSAYNLHRRAKEITLRKLYGASRAAINRLLGREFLILMTLSAIVGMPLAWLFCQRYLAEFIEQAPYIKSSFVIALSLICLIAVFATIRHTLAAMRLSPAKILRN